MDEFRLSGRMLRMEKRKRIEARSRCEQGYKSLAKEPPVTWWLSNLIRFREVNLLHPGKVRHHNEKEAGQYHKKDDYHDAA